MSQTATSRRVIRVSGRFYPPNSLLGFAMRRGNDHHDGTRYLVVLVLAAAILVTVGSAAYALVGTDVIVRAWPVLPVAAFVALVGFRRPIVIAWDRRTLEIRHGSQVLRVDLRRVHDVTVLDPVAYHRNEARANDVRRFVNDYRHRLLRIECGTATLVLGVPEPEAADFLAHVRPPSGAEALRYALAEA